MSINKEDNNNYTIKDNNSEFSRYIPVEYIEPLTIIARVKGHNSIDEYILDLIKNELEMFTDTRDSIDEDFRKYMMNIIPPVEEEEEKEESEGEGEKV